MKKNKKIILCVCIALVIISPIVMGISSSKADEHTDEIRYVIVDGLMALKDGNIDEAEAYYLEAEEQYEKLSAYYKMWESINCLFKSETKCKVYLDELKEKLNNY